MLLIIEQFSLHSSVLSIDMVLTNKARGSLPCKAPVGRCWTVRPHGRC